MFKKRLIIFIFSSLLSVPIFSLSNKDFSYEFLRDFVSSTWTTLEGLPGNTITDVIQDSNGYILLGTYEGLIIFDGVKFEAKSRSQSPEFRFVSARSIFEDSRKNLWIGANDEGVTVITADRNILYYNDEMALPNNSIRSFCEDKEGNVWVGTANGLVVFDKDFMPHTPKGIESLPKGNTYLVTHLYCDTDGRVWIASRDDEGVFYYEDGKFNSYSGLKKSETALISYVTQDCKGNYWFGLNSRVVVKVSDDTKEYYDIGFGVSKGFSINSIMEDVEHNIWIATDSGIAIITEDGRIINFDQIHGLADEKINRIIQDREHNIWIATDRGGIQKINKAKFRTVSLIQTVNAIAEDPVRGVVWLGCDNGLLCQKDNDLVENEITRKFKNVRIRHVDVARDGTLLVSCYEALGQVNISIDGKVQSWTKENGLAGNRVRVALKASDGDVYVGTTSGLSIIDGKTGEITNVNKTSGIQNDYIMCLTETLDGSIWVGTDGGGVFVLKNRHIENVFNTSTGLIGNIVFKIHEYGHQIWVCTGSGISIIYNNQIYNLNSATGLGTDGVFQAIFDKKRDVWGTSNRGIFSVKMSDIQEFVSGKKFYVSSKFYNKSDGIDSGGVTSTSKSMLFSNDEIWFALIDGFCILNTHFGQEIQKKPIVHIQRISLDSDEFSYTGEPVVVSSGTKRVSIAYTGLSFVSPERVTFRTKLIGFDKDFSSWTKQREVSYTNLKPGNYKFLVIAQNADDVLSDASEPLEIVVKPTLFQRWYFWVGLVLIIVLLSYLGIKRRLAYLQKMKTMLEKLVHERTKELTELQRSLEKQVVQRTRELNREKNKVQTLSKEITNALVNTIDAKDKYTNGHSRRVAKYSAMLAEKLGKSKEEVDSITYAGLLHDIGKIGVPDTIINKKDKLDDEEWKIVKEHPVKGYEILDSIESMPEIKQGARWHHERYDGNGYPDRIAGNQIPEIARIICVADAYDSMTSNRSYRKYMHQDVVREQIEKGKGTQFDPVVADKMLEIIDSDKDYLLHE